MSVKLCKGSLSLFHLLKCLLPLPEHLTPTLTMTKGRICLWTSTEQAKSPKTVCEVSWVAETLVQQHLSHCSLWANKISECASKHGAYTDQLVIHKCLSHLWSSTVQTTGWKKPLDISQCENAEDIFRIPASSVAAVPGNALSCASV